MGIFLYNLLQLTRFADEADDLAGHDDLDGVVLELLGLLERQLPRPVVQLLPLSADVVGVIVTLVVVVAVKEFCWAFDEDGETLGREEHLEADGGGDGTENVGLVAGLTPDQKKEEKHTNIYRDWFRTWRLRGREFRPPVLEAMRRNLSWTEFNIAA